MAREMDYVNIPGEAVTEDLRTIMEFLENESGMNYPRSLKCVYVNNEKLDAVKSNFMHIIANLCGYANTRTNQLFTKIYNHDWTTHNNEYPHLWVIYQIYRFRFNNMDGYPIDFEGWLSSRFTPDPQPMEQDAEHGPLSECLPMPSPLLGNGCRITCGNVTMKCTVATQTAFLDFNDMCIMLANDAHNPYNWSAVIDMPHEEDEHGYNYVPPQDVDDPGFLFGGLGPELKREMAFSVRWFRCSMHGIRMFAIRRRNRTFFLKKRTKADVITHLWMKNRDPQDEIYNNWRNKILLVEEDALEVIAEEV